MINLRKEFLIRGLFILAFSFFLRISYAQNLVPNSSFSEFDSTGLHFWKDVVNKTAYSIKPDKGKDTAAHLVLYVYGKYPNSTTFYGMGEYGMLVHLKEPLKTNTYYKLRLKIRQADSSMFLLDNLGVYFTRKKNPDVLLSLSDVNSSDKWKFLEDIYFAKGGEQYLCIGKLSEDGIEISWNNKFKRKKYKSQWELKQDTFRQEACYILDEVVLEKIHVQPAFTLDKKLFPEEILFETARADLSGRAESYLLILASYLRANEKVIISKVGFADKGGSSEYNIKLSKNRAVSVADFLVRHGISKNRINVRWHGSELSTENESEFYLDRKIEIELVST